MGTALSTLTAVWTIRREERETFDLHLDWAWFGNGPIPELPFVYIHNRSKQSISVVELSWLHGSIFRKQDNSTALYNEGPEDVNFPYDVESGQFKKLYLDEDGAKRAFAKAKHPNLFGIVRRSSVWLKVTTMRGNDRTVGAERALPWRDRPRWLIGKDGV